MGIEIEKKFLVKGNSWHTPDIKGTPIKQGYLKNGPEAVVRIRVTGNRAFITVKGKTVGASRLEFEYAIPVPDAVEMLSLCRPPLVEKIRYAIDFKGLEWTIDIFSGSNQGLVVAEIELIHEDQPFEIPPWAGREVTDDPRYYNSNLIRHPFCSWQDHFNNS